VSAIEDRGGVVNKFLGDGVMAIFGAPQPQPDQADRAVEAALAMLERLSILNGELEHEGQPPLEIGIGIHTGPAIVGCVGAVLDRGNGRVMMRREFTAIGDTVNLSQRLEQLTKSLGGPILISERTREQLQCNVAMQRLGSQQIRGLEGEIEVHQVVSAPG
jgi:adenylate cyclase